jgi:hypothetical protein
MLSRSTFRKGLATIALLSVVGVVAALEVRARAEAKRQLLEFRTNVASAKYRVEVERRFHELNASKLTLVKWRAETWIVHTPSEFGATNWELYIDFRHEEPVSLRVRSADSVDHRPQEAPPDLRMGLGNERQLRP